ncbi:MAG TPA: response regulator [Syntrophales bacterium]|nr:response regulator [Syntrophales bacterium]
MSGSPYAILCIDDEENILNAMKRLLRKDGYRLFATSKPAEALAILARERIQLVISDQRMPETSGTDFLGIVRERHPEIIRVILTGYTDVDSITAAINKGLIHKFLLKPWNDEDLRLNIRQALEQYELVQANRSLQETVVAQNEELRRINEKLEEMIRQRTQELEIKNRTLELAHAVLEDVPMAILGVSAEGIVALINREASRLPGIGSSLTVGGELSESFPPDLAAEILQGLTVQQPVPLRNRRIGELVCDIRLTPLSGRFHGRGLVLVIMPVSPLPGCHEQPMEGPCTGSVSRYSW